MFGASSDLLWHCDSQRLLLMDSSFFFTVGVYFDYSFMWNYVFPRWGFTILLLSWGTTCRRQIEKIQLIHQR